jgi:RNA polymerase sigma-70 factor, ECF subfamily
MRIVLNVCRDELRRRRRQPVATTEPADPARAPSDNDDLGLAIARLAEDEQIVLGLRFGRDLTIPQIALALAIPEGTVKSRLHHALEHTRAALDAERRAQEHRR